MSSDQRKSERLEAGYFITVRVEGASATQGFAKAQMTNLSQGGMCFIYPHRLMQNQRLDIDFPFNRPVVRLKSRVVWCRPQRDQFSVGAEFAGISEALRTRFVEMHRAIVEYQKAHNTPGAATMDAHQVAIEWLKQYAEQFLAGVS